MVISTNALVFWREGLCACRFRAIAAAAPVHTAAGFQAACPPAEGLPGGALGAIAAVTCTAIRNGGLQEEVEEVHEVTTLLLEVRTILRLAHGGGCDSTKKSDRQTLSHPASRWCAVLLVCCDEHGSVACSIVLYH